MRRERSMGASWASNLFLEIIQDIQTDYHSYLVP